MKGNVRSAHAPVSLGVCPQNYDHQITQVHGSREGYRLFCCQCRIWRWEIDLRPIRAELRELGMDPDEKPDEKSPYSSVSLKGTREC